MTVSGDKKVQVSFRVNKEDVEDEEARMEEEMETQSAIKTKGKKKKKRKGDTLDTQLHFTTTLVLISHESNSCFLLLHKRVFALPVFLRVHTCLGKKHCIFVTSLTKVLVKIALLLFE